MGIVRRPSLIGRIPFGVSTARLNVAYSHTKELSRKREIVLSVVPQCLGLELILFYSIKYDFTILR